MSDLWDLFCLAGLGAGAYCLGKGSGIKQTEQKHEKQKLEEQIAYLIKQVEELKKQRIEKY
jgi:hypothetical protein